MKEYNISRQEENQRLDKYLKRILPGASTGFLYKMLRKKNITLNGKKATGTELLKEKDQIQVFFSQETLEKFEGDVSQTTSEMEMLCKLPMQGLSIIYEDEDILIANKPINTLSQKANPTDISANEILLGYLLREGKIKPGDFQVFRPSVCNRLDRNTTGLLLMGKTLPGSQMLSSGLRDRTIQKYYRAVVAGRLTEPLHLTGYLYKEESTNTVVLLQNKDSRYPDAKPVKTDIMPVAYGKGCTMVEVHLITGKTHQIRAHLSSIGHPIIGDPKYGEIGINQQFRQKYGIKCQMLHAYRIELKDGRGYIAPLPAYFDSIING